MNQYPPFENHHEKVIPVVIITHLAFLDRANWVVIAEEIIISMGNDEGFPYG
ncbi:MAG: hypothetical protein ACRDD9_20725 [Shewanella sp.]